METVTGFLLALVILAFGLLGFILALILLGFSKAKFAIALILSLILVGLGGYSYFRILTGNRSVNPFGGLSGRLPAAEPRPAPLAEPETTDVKPANGIRVILEVNGARKELRNNEHLTVKRGDALRITEGFAPDRDPKSFRVNFAGFIGDPNNPAEDRGYLINTAGLLKKFAVDKKGDSYKIELLVGKKSIGNVFVDLI